MGNTVCADSNAYASLQDRLKVQGKKDLSDETPPADASAAVTWPLAGKRVGVILYSSYPADPRPRRAAEALIKAGASVEVICLKETDGEARHESFNGAHITRLPLRRLRGGKLSYVRQYASFILLSGVILAGRAFKKRYDLVHVHNMPDVLVLSALVPKLLGAKVILDLHDPMPELMMAIFGLREDSYSVWLLKKLEKWSIRIADAVLTANEACKKTFLARNRSTEKFSVVINAPDEIVFPFRAPSGQCFGSRDASKPFVIMYHGSLVERHGLDLAVTALRKIKKSIPSAELRIYGQGTPFLEQVMHSVRNSELCDAVRYLGPKKLEQIPEAIQDCDIGIIPNRRSIFTEINTPTRIMEFLSQGKVVIAPRTRGILDYFNPQDLVFFELGNADDLAAKVQYVFSNPEEVTRIVQRGQETYLSHKWSGERIRFVSFVARLLKGEKHTEFSDQRQSKSAVSGKTTPSQKRVCMITHSFYESDNRVIRYAETLAQRGDLVEVFALRRDPDTPKEEVISGVRVFRIQDRFGKREKSKSSFLLPALKFLVAASREVTRRHRIQPYDLAHVHNIPDFLVFAVWYLKLTGTKVILDIHDIVPEFFASKFGSSPHSTLVWGLKLVERISAAFADKIIISNHLWLDKYIARSARREKCSVFINNVNSHVFRPRARVSHSGPPIVLFPGGLQWHQGLDIAIRAFKKLRLGIPDAEFHIYGDGMMKPELVSLANDLGLNGSVRFFNPLRLNEIADVMATADLGVVPKRADSFGNEAYSTKIMEFMSVGVPVVVSDTKIDRYYFSDSLVRFFESGNPDVMAEAMYEVLTNPQMRSSMVSQASEYASQNSWDNRKAEYLQLVDSLCARN
jgi:glycosyltransferase involved in cell wall biosynthesis